MLRPTNYPVSISSVELYIQWNFLDFRKGYCHYYDILITVMLQFLRNRVFSRRRDKSFARLLWEWPLSLGPAGSHFNQKFVSDFPAFDRRFAAYDREADFENAEMIFPWGYVPTTQLFIFSPSVRVRPRVGV